MEIQHVQPAITQNFLKQKPSKQIKVIDNRLPNDCFCKKENVKPSFGSLFIPSLNIFKSGDSLFHIINRKGLLLCLSTMGGIIAGLGFPRKDKKVRFVDLMDKSYQPKKERWDEGKRWESEIMEDGVKFSIDYPKSTGYYTKAIATYTFDENDTFIYTYTSKAPDGFEHTDFRYNIFYREDKGYSPHEFLALLEMQDFGGFTGRQNYINRNKK